MVSKVGFGVGRLHAGPHQLDSRFWVWDFWSMVDFLVGFLIGFWALGFWVLVFGFWFFGWVGEWVCDFGFLVGFLVGILVFWLGF